MPLARPQIRSLMIAAAAVAIILAAFVYQPVRMAALFGILVIVSPLVAFVVYYARKLGLNTLFR